MISNPCPNSTATLESLAHPGYLNDAYAQSLAAWGKPRQLPRAGTWVLERPIANSSRTDAMGCYPLFLCGNWDGLPLDCASAGTSWVSLVLVTDPLAPPPAEMLEDWFDVGAPFKDHFIVDFSLEPRISSHHRYYARKAGQACTIEMLKDPLCCLDIWTELYANLARSRNIAGMRAFSREAFSLQLGIPGATVFVAREASQIIGAHIWYISGTNAYSHLTALSDRGYELMASYALYEAAIDYFRAQLQMLDLGAGAGLGANQDDGLTRFKRGWSNATAPAYLCGKILDRDAYASLGGLRSTGYFPAYRSEEFS